jgi:hypothetical protein
MSRKRRDPSAAKARRDRLRAAKHVRHAGSSERSDPASALPKGFSCAAERALRELHALIQGKTSTLRTL